MTLCIICESPLPEPHLERAHKLAHWWDYICTSMAWWATDENRWLDFGPWWQAQEQLSKELEAKHG